MNFKNLKFLFSRQDEGREQTEQLVSPEPDIVCIERDVENDQFICLACDGIFDVFSNEDLADYIISRLQISQQYDMITAEIVDTSLHKVFNFYLLFFC